jgi:folate-binding protein YgfZ
METPLIEVHRAAGTRLAEHDGCLLPEEFSGFEKEYRAATEAVALLDTNWHAIFTLAGRDRVKYLHAVSSNDIRSLAEGQGTLALLLNPQGRILAELAVYALAEKLLVLSHASLREQTLATLRKYVIGSQVQIEDLTDKLGSMAVEGPSAVEIATEVLGVAIGEVAESSLREITVEGVPCYALRRPYFGKGAVEILARREVLPALWGRLLAAVGEHSGEPVGMRALNSLRLEAGIPWFPADFNDGMIPHEAAIENTHISFNKGCYTGQEIVERVRSRGHVNRKRVSLKFSTQAPPATGTKLRAGEADVGFVTSAAYSPAAGSAIGMGYVRREHFAPGSVVEFEGGTAEVRLQE